VTSTTRNGAQRREFSDVEPGLPSQGTYNQGPVMRLAPAQHNRRRHMRFPLGLPVELHVSGRKQPVIVEIVDVSAGGVRLRALESAVSVAEQATLRFVLQGGRACVAVGQVVRVEKEREIILVLKRTNPAFKSFIASL
jgi:hypothetical protein